MARGIGDFLSGAVQGYDVVRRWEEEDRARKWAEEDRGLSMEDRKMRLEDRERAIKEREEDRAIAREDRGFKLEDRAEMKADRATARQRNDYAYGRQLEADKREDTQRRVQSEAYNDAMEAYQRDRQRPPPSLMATVETGGAKVAPPSLTADPVKAVGNARAIEADKKARDPRMSRQRAGKDFSHYYRTVAAPQIMEGFGASGDIEKAQAWAKWMDDAEVQAGIEAYGSAIQAAQVGDEQGFIDSIADAYDMPGYYGDGYTIDRKATGFKKDAKGNIIGATIGFKDSSGKVETIDVGSEQDLYRLGTSVMAPETVFEESYARVKASEAAAAENAGKEADLQRDMAKDANKAMLDARTKGGELSADQKRIDKMMEVLSGTDLKWSSYPPEVQAAKAKAAIDAADAVLGGAGGPPGALGAVPQPYALPPGVTTNSRGVPLYR